MFLIFSQENVVKLKQFIYFCAEDRTVIGTDRAEGVENAKGFFDRQLFQKCSVARESISYRK